MSKYRYGKKDVFAKFPSVEARRTRATRLDREVVADQVDTLREAMSSIYRMQEQKLLDDHLDWLEAESIYIIREVVAHPHPSTHPAFDLSAASHQLTSRNN